MSQNNRILFESPKNEPILNFAPGDQSRDRLKKKLDEMASQKIEIPCIIDGKEVFTRNKRSIVMPHDHGHVLAEFHLAGPDEMRAAAQASLHAKKDWESLGWEERSRVFLKAAELLAGPFRDVINASTMLGQSKNVFQAEIDAACELIDFFKFNVSYYQNILSQQPLHSPLVVNSLDYRPLEGFVLAITPFNFTSIAANLPAAPALVGNTCVWKPSGTQIYSAYYTMKLFEAAGLPPGVINFVPSKGTEAGEVFLKMPELAGVHFTGSTKTFQSIWKTVGENIQNYQSYPRLVGETGGKDFIFAHPSANTDALICAMVRGAFEYQGQKCSAASRAFIPNAMWNKIKSQLIDQTTSIAMGDPRDFRNLMCAVIDDRSFKKIKGYVDHARNASQVEVLAGGKCDSSKGYFIEPTLIQTQDPKYQSICEEIFGPVMSIYVYDESKLDETLTLCDEGSPYALTGAIFAQDRKAVQAMSNRLRYAAGNFYINDKPTGAVVGQQPFGGARASGTNDKAGSSLNLLRWISPRTIKENLNPPTSVAYPHM